MWKVFIRPAMIFIPFTLGISLQSAFRFSWHIGEVDLSLWLIRIALMIMFLQICLRINLSEIKLRKEHFFILLANLAMGLVPYFILKTLGYETLALAAFFTGITPTANAAPVVMSFLEGKVGFVLTGFALTNIVIDILLIAILPMINGDVSLKFMYAVFEQLLVVVGIPILIATILRKKYPEVKNFASKLSTFNFSLWSFTLFVIAAKATEYFAATIDISWTSSIEIAILSAIICAMNFGIGRIITSSEFSREASQTLGQKNTTLTIFLSLLFGGTNAAIVSLGPTFYVLWHNTYNAIQMYNFDKQKIAAKRK